MKINNLDVTYTDGYGFNDTPFVNVRVKSKPVPDPSKENPRKKKKSDK